MNIIVFKAILLILFENNKFYYYYLMQARNIRGQFQRVRDDVYSLLDILALIWKILPFMLFLLIAYNYFDVGVNLRVSLFRILCGKDGLDCGCKMSQEKNGGW